MITEVVIALLTVLAAGGAFFRSGTEQKSAARYMEARAAHFANPGTPLPTPPPPPISPVLAGLALIGVGAFIFLSNHIDRSLQIVQFVDGDCSITLTVPNQAAVADNVSARIRLSGKVCPDPKGATLYLNGVSLGTKGTAGSEGLLSGNVEGLSLRKWVLSFATPGQQLVDATISTLSHGTALLSTTVEVKPGTDLSKTTALITNAGSLLVALSGTLVSLIGFLRGNALEP